MGAILVGIFFGAVGLAFILNNASESDKKANRYAMIGIGLVFLFVGFVALTGG